MATVQIYDNNHTGLSADISFTADTGGTTNLGLQLIPYTFNIDYPYGTYDLYYSQWGQTCSITIFPPTPSFTSIWRTTTSNETIILPTYDGGTYDFVVDWGDGNVENFTTSYVTHNYVTAGDYTVTITGIIEGWDFGYVFESRNKIIEITQWGVLKLGNTGGYFSQCENLVLTGVTDSIILDGTTNLGGMFQYCTSLTTINNISNWDVSYVTYMGTMFSGCLSFNDDLGSWDTSSVTNMSTMFASCQLFNSDISGWNTLNVQDTSSMFAGATVFNQPIGYWNVSNVTSMVSMFNLTEAFDAPIGNWERTTLGDVSTVSNVVDMSYMFNNTYFNQDITNWNVSGVTNMEGMFGLSRFNQDISGWDVSNVLYMDEMFLNAVYFNQDLSGWCVTNIPLLPNDFYTGANDWVGLPGTAPQWGSCP